MSPWLQYPIAFLLGCHAFAYFPFGTIVPRTLLERGEWRGTSLMLSGTFTGVRLRVVVLALHVGAGIALLACAEGIGLAWLFPAWWRPPAVVGASMGLAGFAAFWDGRPRSLAAQGGIGAAISLVLLVSALAFPRAFG